MSHTGDGIWRRLPWVFVVIPLLIVLAAGALLYQAFAPLHDSLNWQRQEFRVECNTPGSQCGLTVTLSYPATLPLEAPSAPGLPLRVWLTDVAAVASQPLTYTVILESPIAEFSFTDQDGQPIAPGASLLLESTQGAPAIWYIRQTPHDTDGLVSLLTAGSHTSVSIALRVFDPKHDELAVSPPAFNINIESSRQALWRRFLQIVLGPTTSILSLVGALVGIILRTVEQERKKQEENNQQETKAEVDGLASLLNTDRTVAINRFVQLANQNQRNPTIRSRINALWAEGWNRRFRDEMVDALVKGDFERARWLKTESNTRDKSAAQDRTIVEATSERAHTEIDDALMPLRERLSVPAPSLIERVGLLTSLAAQRDKVLNEAQVSALVQTLRNTLNEDGALTAFLDNSKTHGGAVAWLTAAPQIREYCRQIAALPTAAEVGAARSLLRLAFGRISWPSLWQSTWTERNEYIVQALARLEWNLNPFGPEHAEEDDRLSSKELWVPSPVEQQLIELEPQLLTAEEGCGQTTSLWRILEWYRQQWKTLPDERENHRDDLVFPVSLNVRDVLRPQARSEHLGELAFGCAKALLTCLSHNPQLFLTTTSHAQCALARLVGGCQGRLGDLKSYLATKESEEGMLESVPRTAWLADELMATAGRAHYLNLFEPTDVLHTLAETRLIGSVGWIVVADISHRHLKLLGATALADRLKPLVAAMPELAVAGVHLKLGIPPLVGQRLLEDTSVTSVGLGCWPADALRCVLDQRVSKLRTGDGSGPAGGLNLLFERNVPFDPITETVKAATGSPQRLVRLGNRLLTRYGQKTDGSGLSRGEFDAEVSKP